MRRGQALVFGALTVFLVALMVVVTLSLGWKTRDRIEAQIAADAAAYSEAVMLARTLNEVALGARTQVALMSSLMAMQALSSWTGHHQSNLVALQSSLSDIHSHYVGACSPFNPCPCGQIGPSAASLAAVTAELARLRSSYPVLDKAAAKQQKQTWTAAHMNFPSADMLDQAVYLLEKQRYADSIVSLANPELHAPEKGDSKALRELYESFDVPKPDQYGKVQPTIQAAFGSRGFDFVTERTGSYDLIQQRLLKFGRVGNPSIGIDPAVSTGGSGLGTGKHSNTVKTVHIAGGTSLWSHDEGGTLSVSWPAGCPASGSASVKDGYLQVGDPDKTRHVYSPGDSGGGARHAISERDKLAWPNHQIFPLEQLKKPANDFGQPRPQVLVQRDYAQVPRRPWDLRFNLHFTGTAAFDLLGDGSAFKSPAGAQLRFQNALSSGLTYYHRPDAWEEPPNLLNPFWRATLAASDDDVPKTLKAAGLKEHAASLEALFKAGLKVTK